MGLAKRYFEFVEGSSSKFWEVWSEGNEVYTRYGKIGAGGQTTVKDQGSTDGAKKLYDKLIKEKTGKGYEEQAAAVEQDEDDADEDVKPAKTAKAPAGGGDHAKRWAAIAKTSGDDLRAALAKEWDFLCDTPKCKQVLQTMLAKVRSASVEDGKLAVLFDDRFDDTTTVTCSPPATGDVSSHPKSWQKFMRQYDGMTCDMDKDVPTYFNGTSGSNAFEQEYIEEVEPELYEKAQDKEIEFPVPIDKGQDWVVANPFKKNKLGEPALYFFSHEGGGFDDPYPPDLGVTGVFLRIMAHDITDQDFFESKADDDEEADDEAGDEGGSSGARRFEFSEGSSSKFWEIRVEGDSHTVRYGKLSTDGQTKTKEFESAVAARKDADKLIAEKTKKGYEES